MIQKSTQRISLTHHDTILLMFLSLRLLFMGFNPGIWVSFFSPKDPRQAMFWPQSISLKSNLFSASFNYHTICSNPLFFAIQYFSLYKLKVFSNRLPLVCLTFLVNVNHFEWLTLQFFTLLMSSFLLLLSRLFQLTLFNEVRKFLNTKASVFYQ